MGAFYTARQPTNGGESGYGGVTTRRELGRRPVRRSVTTVGRQGLEANGCGQAVAPTRRSDREERG
jgi:hypothetical protein